MSMSLDFCIFASTCVICLTIVVWRFFDFILEFYKLYNKIDHLNNHYRDITSRISNLETSLFQFQTPVTELSSSC
jgi:hypothetical protein